jgi:hypothetical protein
MGYYKIRLRAKIKGHTWTDDYNTPGEKRGQTKRYKTLAEAKKAMKKNTWGIPHEKKIVYVKTKKKKSSNYFNFPIIEW